MQYQISVNGSSWGQSSGWVKVGGGYISNPQVYSGPYTRGGMRLSFRVQFAKVVNGAWQYSPQRQVRVRGALRDADHPLPDCGGQYRLVLRLRLIRSSERLSGGPGNRPSLLDGYAQRIEFLSRMPTSTLHVVSEPAENNGGTVRRIGRPFQPGQSGNPGGRPKGVARAFRDVLGGSPTEAARGLLELHALRNETQIGLRPGGATRPWLGVLLRSPAPRARTLSSTTRSLTRSERLLSS